MSTGEPAYARVALGNAHAYRGVAADMYADTETIRRILTELGDTWAVVGLSGNQRRDAYGVAAELRRFGKRVVPVHPRAETVHGEPGYASLAQVPFPIDVVDVFVNSSLAGGVADEAVRAGARAVWFQLGVLDEAAMRRTRAAGLEVVMDRCPRIEIPRLERGDPERTG